MRFWNRLFLNHFFFAFAAFVIFGFILGFFYPTLFQISKMLLLVLFMVAILDFILIFWSKNGITIKRTLPDKLSNSDPNEVKIQIKNKYWFHINVKIIEELPAQFQNQNTPFFAKIKAKESKQIVYKITPSQRGLYDFYNTNVFVSSPLRIISLKYVGQTKKSVKVYPSFLKLNQFDLKTIKSKHSDYGQRQVRRIGNSLEFEQIKEYNFGDDIRTINWKSTAKQQKFMVNQFVDQKAQQVYCIIDKGRAMKMPFNQLTLLDYAINSSLVLANLVLQNQDKMGIFTFSKRIENLLPAERRTGQIQRIADTLYNVKTNFKESDFGALYAQIKTQIKHRSLLILFTNFESFDSLERQLPYLQAINQRHLLVLVFFNNTSLEEFAKNPANNKQEMIEKSVAEKLIFQKKRMIKELQKNKIIAILTKPNNLSTQIINQYINIKQKAIL